MFCILNLCQDLQLDPATAGDFDISISLGYANRERCVRIICMTTTRITNCKNKEANLFQSKMVFLIEAPISACIRKGNYQDVLLSLRCSLELSVTFKSDIW